MIASQEPISSAAPISQGPALLLGAVALAGLILLFVACRLARSARRCVGWRTLCAVAGVWCAAAFLLIAAAQGFRHYGGHAGYDGAYRCDAWWAQMGSSRGAAEGDDDSWPQCKVAAEKAVGPGIGEAAIGGILVGTIAAIAVQVRRRRVNTHLRPSVSAPDRT